MATEKPGGELVPLSFLFAVNAAMRQGAGKYGAGDYLSGEKPMSHYYNKVLRHLAEWQSGVPVDHESGLSPLAHVAANIVILQELQRDRPDLDDRVHPLPLKTAWVRCATCNCQSEDQCEAGKV